MFYRISLAGMLLFASGSVTMPALAQAIVESAILGSAAAAASPGVKGAGAASAGVFEAVRKALAAANQPGMTASTSPVSPPSTLPLAAVPASAATTARLATIQPKDLSGVKVGLRREELIKLYGPPALKTVELDRDRFVETYTYLQQKNQPVTVTLHDGVVASQVTPASPARQGSGAVITLP